MRQCVATPSTSHPGSTEDERSCSGSVSHSRNRHACGHTAKVQESIVLPQDRSTPEKNRCSGKKIADVPVVVQSQVPVIEKLQKTVEVPQVQFIDKVIDVPMQRQAQPIDKVVDVPEV